MGATFHVAPGGNDTNSGTADQPLASVVKAVSMVQGKTEPSEIVIHAGVYQGCPGDGVVIGRHSQTSSVEQLPPLLITAAKKADGSYEEVWFDGGRKISQAEPVADLSGVYKTEGKFDLGSSRPQMWEVDTRTRYDLAADLAAVGQFPASFWCNEAPRETLRSQSEAKEGGSGIFFHTSDGRPPEAHELFIARDSFGMYVWRQNTTLRGLRFRNFVASKKSSGVVLRASNTTIEDCYAWNCLNGFNLLTLPDFVMENMRLRRCTTEDCAGGVYLDGKHGIVEDCRFFKIRDKFIIPVNRQNDCAIQYYHPAIEGEVRRNLCVGFADGIFMKCPSSVFIVEYNTVVDGSVYGIGCTAWHPKSIFRCNIATGFVWPILSPDGIPQGAVVDYNCFWKNAEQNALKECLETPRKAGTGEHNFVKDPRFANPSKGDYRLLPDSPCLKMGAKGLSSVATSEARAKEEKNCGAFGPVGPDFKDVQPPEILLSLAPPARQAGGSGELYFERDPWIGGGTNLIRQLPPENKAGEWITPEPRVGLIIQAEDFVSKPAQMKIKIGDGAWTMPEPYAKEKEISFPSNTPKTSVSVMVSDTAMNWSVEKTLMIRVAKAGPRLKSAPTVYANDNGVIIVFETDIPCLAKLEFGADNDYGHALEQPRDIQHSWSAADGGDWVEIRSKPAVTNCLALLKPAVAPGKTCHYRLILQDEVGNKTVTDDATFIVKGAAKSYFVSPRGTDAESRGTRENPFRTIQFAVDRALPGDRIILLPGLYPGETKLTHGGVEGVPLTIEADQPDTVILDGRHEAKTCLRLEKAPYVVIKGFEIRWFAHVGVYATDSPNVTVAYCRVWNSFRGSHGVELGEIRGTFAHRSSGFIADHNVIYEIGKGIYLLQSPRSRVTYNTVCRNDYGGAGFDYSAEGSVNRNNSFAYSGNDQFTIEGSDTNELATFDSDYNNLGTKLAGDKTFEIKDNFFQYHGSKAIIALNGKRFHSLKKWQDATGKDLHSIFKDPIYSDAAHGDYHLKANSPNIGAGEGGATIGALGVKEK
jgi:hypothetical protein